MGNCCVPFFKTYSPDQAVKKEIIRTRKKDNKHKCTSFSKLQLEIQDHGGQPTTNNNSDKAPAGQFLEQLAVPCEELHLVVTTPGGTEKPPEVIRFNPVLPVAMDFEESDVLAKIDDAVSKHRNLTSFLVNEIEKYGNETALVDSEAGKSYTFKQVIEQINFLAVGLQKLGVQQGDVLCMCTPNNIEYPIVFCAVVLIGGVFQTANPLYTVDDLVRSFGNCSTKYVITGQEMLTKLKQVKQQVDTIQKIILLKSVPKEPVDEAETESEDVVMFENLLNKEDKIDPVEVQDPKTTLALLLASSGTTGHPKAVQHSHYSIISAMLQIANLHSSSAGAACVLFLPMFHVYALVIITCTALQKGMKLIVMPRFDPEKYLQLIQDNKAELLHVVPPVMIMLSKHPKVQEYDLSSIKNIISAAAPLSLALETSVRDRLGVPHTFQGYGMTEAPVIFSNTPEQLKEGSVGTALPGVEYKIVDVETKVELEQGKNGELCIKGPQVTMGYLNNVKATTELFDNDGWMHTGDIGYVDSDGFLFIVDRLKELIKYKGFQVAPAELEDLLLQNPAVLDCAVIGVPDEESGELPRAFVVKKSDVEITEKDIQIFVDEKVAPHMKLRGGVEFLTEIPKSASGKILRKDLKSKVMSSLERKNVTIPG